MESKEGEEPPPCFKVVSTRLVGGETGDRAEPWAFPLAASVPREQTVTSAPGSEKQGREQQLQNLLKLLLKMTRHFPGNVTTIWALGTGDEAESRGGQAWSPPTPS